MSRGGRTHGIPPLGVLLRGPLRGGRKSCSPEGASLRLMEPGFDTLPRLMLAGQAVLPPAGKPRLREVKQPAQVTQQACDLAGWGFSELPVQDVQGSPSDVLASLWCPERGGGGRRGPGSRGGPRLRFWVLRCCQCF